MKVDIQEIEMEDGQKGLLVIMPPNVTKKEIDDLRLAWQICTGAKAASTAKERE